MKKYLSKETVVSISTFLCIYTYTLHGGSRLPPPHPSLTTSAVQHSLNSNPIQCIESHCAASEINSHVFSAIISRIN